MPLWKVERMLGPWRRKGFHTAKAAESSLGELSYEQPLPPHSAQQGNP